MKLTTRDIAGFLDKRPNVAVVLVYGPDRGLVKERAQILAKKIVSDINDPFNTAVLTGDQITQDPARFIDEASAISLMGGDRLITLRDCGDGVTATLKSYLQSPVKGTWVIIEGDDLPAKSSLRKLCEADKNAAALPCYVQEGADLSRSISSAVRAANLRIDPAALEFMTSVVGGDASQVRAEIEKLLTYMNVGPDGMGNGATITYDDVVACSGAMGLANLDAFIDAVLGGDSARAFALYGRLEDDGIPGIALIRAILNHGRKIQGVQLRIQNGERLDDILEARDAPVFFKRKAAFAAQVRKWPSQRLSALMHDMFLAEGKLKSGIDPDVTLPQLLLSLSVRASKAA